MIKFIGKCLISQDLQRTPGSIGMHKEKKSFTGNPNLMEGKMKHDAHPFHHELPWNNILQLKNYTRPNHLCAWSNVAATIDCLKIAEVQGLLVQDYSCHSISIMITKLQLQNAISHQKERNHSNNIKPHRWVSEGTCAKPFCLKIAAGSTDGCEEEISET